jgi:hypothetical protein
MQRLGRFYQRTDSDDDPERDRDVGGRRHGPPIPAAEGKTAIGLAGSQFDLPSTVLKLDRDQTGSIDVKLKNIGAGIVPGNVE